ncbi:Phosphatidate cytidylyltransferase [Yarrowia sp. B02]|nr:Phosphatidate cytidylyltransferase [Yarrowia sp. B02]
MLRAVSKSGFLAGSARLHSYAPLLNQHLSNDKQQEVPEAFLKGHKQQETQKASPRQPGPHSDLEPLEDTKYSAAARHYIRERRAEEHLKNSPEVEETQNDRLSFAKDPSIKRYLDANLGSVSALTRFSDLPQDFGSNQQIPLDAELRTTLRQVLWTFKAPIRYSFAYGSGVFSQGKESNASKPQVDLIFGVKYPNHWHSLNLKQNPHHYSGLKYLGSDAIAAIQETAAGCYFNPYVEINGLKIKYGVVSMETLSQDLSEWNKLYMAGRMHKPVRILRDDPQMRFVNQANLISALRTALLLLPRHFSELDLYKTIAGISYMGDPRMHFGENPHKIRNIVENQFANFRRLYSPIMDTLPNLSLQSVVGQRLNDNSSLEVGELEQDMDATRRGNMVVRLPAEFKSKLYTRYAHKVDRATLPDDPHFMEALSRGDASGSGAIANNRCSEFDRIIASDPHLEKEAARIIRHTVGWTSAMQTFKGIFTAGLARSAKYSLEKIRKANKAK